MKKNLEDNFVKMCTSSYEIQSLWKHSKRSSGDWYFHKELNGVYCTSEQDQGDKHCFWLPRQDQLQELCKHGNTTHLELLNRLALKAKGADYIYYEYNWTMEQLWLAFYMKEEHDKIWIDFKEEWVLTYNIEEGDTVEHQKFGRGEVAKFDDDKIWINFEQFGEIELIFKFANLKKIETEHC